MFPLAGGRDVRVVWLRQHPAARCFFIVRQFRSGMRTRGVGLALPAFGIRLLDCISLLIFHFPPSTPVSIVMSVMLVALAAASRDLGFLATGRRSRGRPFVITSALLRVLAILAG
jgi:hypothetical protein